MYYPFIFSYDRSSILSCYNKIRKGCINIKLKGDHKNIFHHKNGHIIINLYTTYMLHLSLEAKFIRFLDHTLKLCETCSCS